MEKKRFDCRFSSFIFIKVNPKFRLLLSNERIAAKQELENMIAACQEEVFLRTYSLVGLRAECDMLLWLVAPTIESIQKTWSRVSTSGAGKYFVPSLCFLGLYQLPDGAPAKKERDAESCIVPKNLFGKFKYMLLHPLVRSHDWYELSEAEQQKFAGERSSVLAKYPSVAEHFFYSYGLDEQEFIVVRESETLESLAMASRELREQRIKKFAKRDTPSLLCIGSDLSSILDSLG